MSLYCLSRLPFTAIIPRWAAAPPGGYPSPVWPWSRWRLTWWWSQWPAPTPWGRAAEAPRGAGRAPVAQWRWPRPVEALRGPRGPPAAGGPPWSVAGSWPRSLRWWSAVEWAVKATCACSIVSKALQGQITMFHSFYIENLNLLLSPKDYGNTTYLRTVFASKMDCTISSTWFKKVFY